MGTNARSVVPPRLDGLRNKNPAGVATGELEASLTRFGYGQRMLLNTLCPDNGGNSGARTGSRQRVPRSFCLQLRGPFSAAVRAGLTPTPALWAAVSALTRPHLRFVNIGGIISHRGYLSRRLLILGRAIPTPVYMLLRIDQEPHSLYTNIWWNKNPLILLF
jgi:hypothetical protein